MDPHPKKHGVLAGCHCHSTRQLAKESSLKRSSTRPLTQRRLHLMSSARMTRKSEPLTASSLVFALGTEQSDAINSAELKFHKFHKFPVTSESTDARVVEPCPKLQGSALRHCSDCGLSLGSLALRSIYGFSLGSLPLRSIKKLERAPCLR